MKLIVQADDFAMTDALAEGIIKCARDGVLTQTGLMTNGPHAEYYARIMIEQYPHVALGQEINLVSGKPLSDPKDIPTLVDENGILLRSVEHKKKDLTDPHHVKYEDAYKEIEAQLLKYMDICGHKPYFIGLHSYGTQEMRQAMSDIIEKYQLPDVSKIRTDLKFGPIKMGPWYPLNNIPKKGEIVKNDVASVTSLDYQFNFDPVKMFLDGGCGYITDYVEKDNAVTKLHTHAGYIDKELIDMSTLRTTRLLELNLICSDELKNWIRENHVELTNARDLVK